MSFDPFLSFLKHEKRYSDHTVSAYIKDLEQFSEYLASEFDEKDLNSASYQMVRSWVVQLMDNDYSPRTVQRKLSALRNYYRFLKRQGILKVNPIERVVAPKAGKPLPAFIEEGNMLKFEDDSMFEDSFSGARDKLLMHLFYETGMRRAELINLQWSQVDKSQSHLRVIGKRNKERIIPVSAKLMDEISRYEMLLKSEFEGINEAVVLVTDKGKKMYPRFVHNKVKHYLSLVTTVNKKSPHVLRHTFATHLLNNGANLNSVKELLGHASLASTQIYTHNTIEKLKEVHKLTHPKG